MKIRTVIGWVAIVASVLAVLLGILGIWTRGDISVNLVNTSGLFAAVAAVGVVSWGLAYIYQDNK